MKIIRAFIFVAAFGFVVWIAFASWCWRHLNEPVKHNNLAQPITISTGTTAEQAISLLHQRGIIKQKFPVIFYLKAVDRGSVIKAGDYFFRSPITAFQAIRQLEEGGNAQHRITVVEGWTRWDIADAMLRIQSLKLKNKQQALYLMSDVRAIKSLDSRAKNLEGYLYPETYYVMTNTTAKSLVQEMVEQFKRIWYESLDSRARDLRVTPHDVVTVASIIETEAKLDSERPIVASVIYNRLRRGMTLSVDSTLVYASKLAGKWKNDGKVYQSDIDRKSAYNTRQNLGLPLGPVGSPGLPSLKAALNPANTNYLYYVRNPQRNDGAHNFYATPQEFEGGVQALRTWEQRHLNR